MSNEMAGRTCPYDQAVIKPGQEVVVCSQCGVAHHKECWEANGGCTSVGCTGAPLKTNEQSRPITTAGIPVTAFAKLLSSNRFRIFIYLSVGMLILAAVLVGVFAYRWRPQDGGTQAQQGLGSGQAIPDNQHDQGFKETLAFKLPTMSVGWLRIAKSGSTIATWVEKDGKQWVIRDGNRLGEMYDKISFPGPIYSPNGESIAYTAELGRKHLVIRDGSRVGEVYDDVSPIGYLAFSPDSRSLAFRAKSEGKWFMVLNGTRVGHKYDYVGTPAFSSDGRKLLFAAAVGGERGPDGLWKGGKWFLIVNGHVLPGSYDEIGGERFAPKGHSHAFAAKADGKWRVVRDGTSICGPYDVVGTWSLTFSPDGKSLAFAAASGGEWFVVKDGIRVCPGYAAVDELVFSPDGHALAFKAESYELSSRKAFVVWNGAMGPRYDDVSMVTFSPDGLSLCYYAEAQGKYFVVRDGRRVGKEYENCTRSYGRPVFSSDSSSIAYWVTIGGRDVVVRDGEEIRGPYDFKPDSLSSQPIWGQGSGSVAFRALIGGGREYGQVIGGKYVLIKDGKRIGGQYDALSEIGTTADAKRCVVVGLRGDAVYRIEVPWKAFHPDPKTDKSERR